LRVKVKKLSADARIPKVEHDGDAGFDLYSNENTILKPMERKLIGTGISMAFEKGFEAQVRPKSGQVVFNKIEEPEIVEAEELEKSSRGQGGFGSTGVD